ncbi:MAG TPA: PAS domain S-box protein, partial [Nitrospiraceae bacterium]|nr:PAS domain S-box protein [Nitrospiraceae bacterium]
MHVSAVTAAFAERVKALARRRDLEPPSQALSDALAELETGLKELMAAEQELHDQREILEETQRQLDKERRRYQELFDFAPDGYVVTDGLGVIAEANHVAANLLRVERSHLTGQALTEFVAETDRPIFRACLSEFQHGKRESMIAWMSRLQPRGALSVSVSVACNCTKDATGKVDGLRWLFRDMTRTARADDSRRAGMDRFRFLFQAHPLPMWVFDLETLRFLEVNDAAVRRYGYTPEEFLALTIHDLHPVDDHSRLIGAFSSNRRGLAYRGEFRHRAKDGTL